MEKFGKKKTKKLELAIANSLQLYSSFYPLFYLLESTLKSRLFELLKRKLGTDWFTVQLDSPKTEPLFDQEKELILRRKPKGFTISDQRFLEESGLGVWVEFFNRELYKTTKGWPIHVFENLPKDVKRKDIYVRLVKIKELRNQLAHSRIPPLTSTNDLEKLHFIVQTAKELEEILGWMGSLPPTIISSTGIQEKGKKLKKQLLGKIQ